MKKKNRFGKTLSFFLVIFGVFLLTFKTAYDAGEFNTVFDHPLPSCVAYKNISGPEDMITVDEGRTVLVSAADRLDKGSKPQNGVYRFSGDSEPTLLYPTEGIPHGITAVKTEMGSRIFLIVHEEDQNDRVEVLDWSTESGTLRLIKSIPFEGVSFTLNGIAAVDEDRFFVSQDFAYGPGPIQMAEKFLRLSLGKVWFYDGQKPKLARENLLYPNGLAVSADQKQLYLASLTGRKIIVYDLALPPGQNASLKWRREWALQSGPDNLKWANGDLLIGSHRRLLSALLHSFNPKTYGAPSQLLRVKGLPDAAEIEELHASKAHNGSQDIAAISGGVLQTLGQKIVMGGIYTDGILACEGSRYYPAPRASLTEVPD